MKYEILYQPSFAVARVMLDPGDSVRAESGAMMAMSATVSLQSKAHGGIGKALGRLLGGESAFQTTYSATNGAGEVLFAPAMPGDIMPIQLQNQAMVVTSGSFLACDLGIEIQTQANLRGFFAGESVFMLRAAGSGTLLVNSFGAIHAVQLAPGQPYIVDTGHLVAFSEGMGFELRKATQGLLQSFTSGEGIVVQLTGPGIVYTQTRTPQGFGAWLSGLIPGRG
jgi:uncharacterized protein (TIGR00266 family)